MCSRVIFKCSSEKFCVSKTRLYVNPVYRERERERCRSSKSRSSLQHPVLRRSLKGVRVNCKFSGFTGESRCDPLEVKFVSCLIVYLFSLLARNLRACAVAVVGAHTNRDDDDDDINE